MTDEEMLERAAELLGSRDYAEVQDKQGLLKKIIEREACAAKIPVSSLVAALEKGMTFGDARRFFYHCVKYDSKKEFLAHYFYKKYFLTSLKGVWEDYNEENLIRQKLIPQIDNMLDHFNESIEKLPIKDRVTCEDPETGKFYALSEDDSEEVTDEDGNLDFSRL